VALLFPDFGTTVRRTKSAAVRLNGLICQHLNARNQANAFYHYQIYSLLRI